MCNSKAYRDAFKASEPIKAMRLLNIGVYGYEDLATRCVRKQKNNENQVEIVHEYTESIERESFISISDYEATHYI